MQDAERGHIAGKIEDQITITITTQWLAAEPASQPLTSCTAIKRGKHQIFELFSL